MADGHREALLAAARSLLRTKGLRATTARDLVTASGTNLASIGYHFGSKDALMATALASVFDEWTARPVEAAGAAGAAGPGEPDTSGAALAAAIRTMLDDLPGRRSEILAFADGVVAAGRDEQVGTVLGAAAQRSLDAVASSMRAATPGLPAEAAAAAASVVVAVHDGLALQSITAPAAVPAPDAVVVVLAALGSVLGDALGMTRDQVTALMAPQDGGTPAP